MWDPAFPFPESESGWEPVRGAGGGKDEALDASRLHGAQKDERARDIVHIVLERILDGFSHVDVGGEVDHGIKIACHQERIHHGSIAQVPFDQLHFRIHDGSDMSIYHVV